MPASALRASQRISLNSGVSFRTTMTPTVPLRLAACHCLRSSPPRDCGADGARILVARMSYGIPNIGETRWIITKEPVAEHCQRTGQQVGTLSAHKRPSATRFE
jgi:hypothetical protein